MRRFNPTSTWKAYIKKFRHDTSSTKEPQEGRGKLRTPSSGAMKASKLMSASIPAAGSSDASRWMIWRSQGEKKLTTQSSQGVHSRKGQENRSTLVNLLELLVRSKISSDWTAVTICDSKILHDNPHHKDRWRRGYAEALLCTRDLNHTQLKPQLVQQKWTHTGRGVWAQESIKSRIPTPTDGCFHSTFGQVEKEIRDLKLQSSKRNESGIERTVTNGKQIRETGRTSVIWELSEP